MQISMLKREEKLAVVINIPVIPYYIGNLYYMRNRE